MARCVANHFLSSFSAPAPLSNFPRVLRASSKEKEEYFDSKIDELKAANNGQPISYEHPEVAKVEVEVQQEEEREDFAPFM